MKGLRRYWRDHSLTIVTVAVFVAMTGLVVWAGYQVWQAQGGEKANGPYWTWIVYEYHLSLVADVFGGLYLIRATKRFKEKGSPESGDTKQAG